VTVDASDRVYAAGAVDSTGTYNFGNGVTVSTADGQQRYYAVLVEYDASGLARSARSSVNSGSSADIFDCVTLDSSGRLYGAGVIAGPGRVDFGNNVALIGAAATTSPGWSSLLVRYR
jgi:hypothetical protein